MSRRVTCITKDARLDRISHIGGEWGKVTEEEAIAQISNDPDSYYVQAGFNKVKVIIGDRLGRAYLKTEIDGTRADNLLSLPNCF